MPSSLVDALRMVATIHPEWVAMALQAPSSARASTIATLLQEAAAHLSLAVEATTLREVAAAISTTVAMPHDNGERLQQKAYATPDAPLVVMLMLGQNCIPMHVQLWGQHLNPKQVCKLGQTSMLVQSRIYTSYSNQHDSYFSCLGKILVAPGHTHIVFDPGGNIFALRSHDVPRQSFYSKAPEPWPLPKSLMMSWPSKEH
jgi:hypothetical protein